MYFLDLKVGGWAEGSWKITLSKSRVYKDVVLHEIAHIITYQLDKDDLGHGNSFKDDWSTDVLDSSIDLQCEILKQLHLK